MRKYWHMIWIFAAVTFFTAGCGTKDTEEKQPDITETESGVSFIAANDGEYVPTVIDEYAEEEVYPALAEFLGTYYQIPDEYQSKTRYYYNYVDLNDDGKNEIFAAVIGEYTQKDAGDPALLLMAEEDGTFMVLEDFPEIHTPVTISEETANGWHDLIFKVYGKGVQSGYQVYTYTSETGKYQTDEAAFFEEMPQVSGTQILANNLIDDMDKGRYLTLIPEQTETESEEKNDN